VRPTTSLTPSTVETSSGAATAAPTPRARLRRGRVVLLPFLGLLAVLVLGACQVPGQSNAINGDNRPTGVSGATNGNLPASDLVTLNSSCRAYKQVAGSLAALLVAANKAGIPLGTSECYRDYAGQVYQRNAWCSRGMCGNAAVPGYSNHGWGKAVDLNVNGSAVEFSGATFSWLMLHAGTYGFVHPNAVPTEAWHWEWVGDGGTMHGTPVKPDLWSWPMHVGANGDDVKQVQQALAAQGLPVTVDGSYGPNTNGAVSFFQITHHLPVSGSVDLPTAMALRAFS
jgi:D-alanyl-D-alanine carboxypeptidase